MPILVKGAAHDVYSLWSDASKKDYEQKKLVLLSAFSLNPTHAYAMLKERVLKEAEGVEAYCADIHRLPGLVSSVVELFLILTP